MKFHQNRTPLPRAGAGGKRSLISPALPLLMCLKGSRPHFMGISFGSPVHIEAHIFNRQAFRAMDKG